MTFLSFETFEDLTDIHSMPSRVVKKQLAFFDLPQELRDLIYAECLPNACVLHLPQASAPTRSKHVESTNRSSLKYNLTNFVRRPAPWPEDATQPLRAADSRLNAEIFELACVHSEMVRFTASAKPWVPPPHVRRLGMDRVDIIIDVDSIFGLSAPTVVGGIQEHSCHEYDGSRKVKDAVLRRIVKNLRSLVKWIKASHASLDTIEISFSSDKGLYKCWSDPHVYNTPPSPWLTEDIHISGIHSLATTTTVGLAKKMGLPLPIFEVLIWPLRKLPRATHVRINTHWALARIAQTSARQLRDDASANVLFERTYMWAFASTLELRLQGRCRRAESFEQRFLRKLRAYRPDVDPLWQTYRVNKIGDGQSIPTRDDP